MQISDHQGRIQRCLNPLTYNLNPALLEAAITP